MLDFVSRLASNAESYAARLKSEIKGDVEDALSRTASHLSSALAKIAIWIVAAILLSVALAFATAATYQALLNDVPAEQAALIVAGAYAVLALVCVAVALNIGKPKTPVAPPRLAAPAEPAPAPPPSPQPDAPVSERAAPEGVGNLDLSRIAELLGAVGRPNEQAALLVANEIAKSLTPPQLLAAGLAAGFVLGRKIGLPGGRRRDPA